MDHLDDVRLDALIFDAVPLAVQETSHVAECPHCRERIAARTLLRDELGVARLSQPTPQQLTRYSRLFDEVAVQSLGQKVRTFLETLRLSLVMDSRHSALGLRRAAGFGHRLLYSSEEVDVELLLEPEGSEWQIDGDVLPFDPDTINAPYLVELQSSAESASISDPPLYAAPSEASGRFRLTGIPSGRYRLSLTPARGPAIEIPGLEIP